LNGNFELKAEQLGLFALEKVCFSIIKRLLRD